MEYLKRLVKRVAVTVTWWRPRIVQWSSFVVGWVEAHIKFHSAPIALDADCVAALKD